MTLRKHRYPPIDPADPFKDDRLQRRDFAAHLTPLVQSLQEPFVLAIDGAWGSGKTTFATMWKAELEAAGHPCVLFNAWTNDTAEDPLLALMADVERALSIGTGGKTGSRFRALIRAAGPLVLRVATQGLIDTEMCKALAGGLSGAVGGLSTDVESFTRAKLKQQAEVAASVETFRKALEDFAAELSAGGGRRPPLVFIIDELDRCKPTFAIALLERVKHLFSVPNVCFVLVVDREQLGHSLRAVYGAGLNADGYLRRFIDLTVPIPPADVTAFARHLLREFELRSLAATTDGQVERFAEAFAAFGFSLRAVEQTFTQLNVTLRLLGPEELSASSFIVFLAVLHAAHRETYRGYIDGSTQGAEVVKFLRSLGGKAVRLVEADDHMLNDLLIGMSRVKGESENYLLDLQQRGGVPETRIRRVAWAKAMSNSLPRFSAAIEFAGNVR